MVDVKPRRSKIVEEVFNNNEIDPDSIQGLSREARKLLKSKKDIKLFNQRGKKDFINKYELEDIKYYNIDLLRDFLNPVGGIVSSRITKADRAHQRALAQAIKRARELALIPFPNQADSAAFFDQKNPSHPKKTYKKPAPTLPTESQEVADTIKAPTTTESE